MGDLQCPARLYLTGRWPEPAAAEWLRHERLAAVVELAASPDAAAGEPLAESLGGAEAAAGILAQLQDVADRHRGEAVLVVGDPGLLAQALRGVASGWARAGWPAGQPVLGLQVDADGWRLQPPQAPG